MRHQKVLRRGIKRCALRLPDTAIRCDFRDGGCLEATQVYKYLSMVGEMWYDRCLRSVPTGSNHKRSECFVFVEPHGRFARTTKTRRAPESA